MPQQSSDNIPLYNTKYNTYSREVYDSPMLDHHIQRQIVSTLKSSDALTFSELKSDTIDNKLFTYHLKATMREKFVEKMNDGKYQLTPTGRKLWKRMAESPDEISLRAHSVLYLVVHHEANGWLLYRRKTHPLKDHVGFMHATPNVSLRADESASKELLSNTGLRGSFQVVGSGFFRTYTGSVVDSFTNFTLLLCEDAHGTLKIHDENADYFWVEKIGTSIPRLLPNMPALLEALSEGYYPFFLDMSVSTSSGGE